jgi:hypothetical protein
MAIKIVEKVLVTCPYCIVGAGEVTVERTRDSVTFDQKYPIQCRACNSYFKLKPSLTIQGVRLPEHDLLKNTTMEELTNGR